MCFEFQNTLSNGVIWFNYVLLMHISSIISKDVELKNVIN